MKKHLEVNKSLITNGLALALIALGLATHNGHVLFVGSYAFSGAITNWIAIVMLFEKIPFLYGSGVIPSRFEDFKRGIKNLIMLQFFTTENIERFFKDSTDSTIRSINVEPLLDAVDYDRVFNELTDAIMESSFGSMLSMMGGADALKPLRDPFVDKLRGSLLNLSQSEEFSEALAKQTSFFHPEQVEEKVASMVQQRLDELTPTMVKIIIQEMIRRHLGWLVVWGGVFGGLIGGVVSFL